MQNTKELIEQMKNQLSTRQFDIICLMFGLDNGMPKSTEEVAQLFGTDKEQITQIFETAMKKISLTPEELINLAKEIRENIPKNPRKTILSDLDSELLDFKFDEP